MKVHEVFPEGAGTLFKMPHLPDDIFVVHRLRSITVFAYNTASPEAGIVCIQDETPENREFLDAIEIVGHDIDLANSCRIKGTKGNYPDTPDLTMYYLSKAIGIFEGKEDGIEWWKKIVKSEKARKAKMN